MADGDAPNRKKKAPARKRDEVLIRAVRAEVVKPLCGRSWDELGTDLRAIRAVSSRAINAAVTACELSRVGGWDVAPESCAYRAILWEIASFNAWAKESRDETTKRYAEVEIAGGTLAAWEQYAFRMWKRWLKEGRRSSLPSAKYGAPILIRKQEWEFVEGDGIAVSIRLTAAGTSRHQLLLKAGHGSSWGRLRGMQKGELERRDLKLVYSEKDSKWFAILSFEEPPPKAMTGKHVLVVHRGCRNFLTLLRDDGRSGKIPGTKLLAFKRSMRARSRSIQEATSRGELGNGARGHGRKRHFKSLDALKSAEENFLKTHIQQTTARVSEIAKEWDCGEIVWEDYGGIGPSEERGVRRFVERYPLFKLGQAIAWVCKCEGFKATQTPAEFISTTCPACGAVDADAHNQRTGIFHCKGCKFERPVDWVAAYWMLCRVRPENGAKKALRAVQALTEKAKKGK